MFKSEESEKLQEIHVDQVIYGPEPAPEEKVYEATEKESLINEYAGSRAAAYNIKEQKYVALYKARTIISEIGTMQERSICKSQLKRMKKLGLSSL